MNNTFYFLRHGETRKDNNVPISKWVLSVEGGVPYDVRTYFRLCKPQELEIYRQIL